MANYHKLDIQNLSIKMANGNVEAENKIIEYYIKYINKFIEINCNDLDYNKEELRNKMLSILYKTIKYYKINYENNKTKLFSSFVVGRIIQFYNSEMSKQKSKKEYKNREIQILADRMINGDIEAQNKIIEFYSFHIKKLVENKYCNSNYEKEDLIQIAITGLLKAINAYKLKHNSPFCTYAYTYIRNEIEISLNAEKKTPNIEYIGLANKYKPKSFEDFIENTEVRDAIKKLSDVKKKILYLYIYGKYTFDDIANMFGFTHQMAQKHYKHSIELIRQELDLPIEKQKKL